MPSNPIGLTSTEARIRLEQFGPNEPAVAARRNGWHAVVAAVLNPLALILLGAAAVSAWLGEKVSAVVIGLVVSVSATIQFIQSYKSDRAISRLRREIALTATVKRDGDWHELPCRDIVPGDLVRLSAGDLVPADARLVEARDLHVQQAALTGESLPVEKQTSESSDPATPDRANLVFFGTSVISGIATAEVLETGPRTLFGSLAAGLVATPPETEFDRGTRQFSFFVARTVLAMVAFVFLVGTIRHRDVFESLLFALALAVGLTPELLPMIVSVTLARGAIRMARRHVVVKHLASIQNLGSIDVLCTDKTGTLTRGEMSLERWLDPAGQTSDEVLRLAFLNSGHETGIRNPLDAAILAKTAPLGMEAYRKRDEVPFDFERRRASVIVDGPDRSLLIVKGAPESLLEVCSSAVGVADWNAAKRARQTGLLNDLGTQGFRVLGVAFKSVEPRLRYTPADESELTFAGYLAFRDSLREDSAAAIRALHHDGVRVVMISGDSEAVARAVAVETGLPAERVVSGSEIDRLSDPALGVVAEQACVFARVSPMQKTRILAALRARGHVVGFLGDGTNDAPALHRADVGISVSTAVDVAKEAADVILLQPGLRVLHAGIIEGRQAFGNVTKYLLMGTSSNFGNMLSMAVAMLFLPFLPMLPSQVLVNNLLYDLAQLSIPTDRVDRSFARKPRRWNIDAIRRFMLIAGPVSSAFDLLTFVVLLLAFRANDSQFHTAWFVESLLTQTLVVLVIRTAGNPFRSRPSRWLLLSVSAVALTAMVLPYTPFAKWLVFVPLPWPYLAVIVVLAASYLFAMAGLKRFFFREAEPTIG